jgi:hypothetical protein
VEGGRSVLDEVDVAGPSGEGFQAHRPGSREEVEEAASLEVVRDEVERTVPDGLGRGTDAASG